MHSKFKVLLVGILLFIPTFADSAVFPTQQTLCVGGSSTGQRCFTDLTNLISLYAIVNGGYSTLRKVNGSGGVGYQVTAGKTLRIAAVICSAQAAASISASMAYGTADGGFSNGSAPTGVVRIAGAGATTDYWQGVATAGGILTVFPNWDIPANDFPVIYNGSGNNESCYAYGYET